MICDCFVHVHTLRCVRGISATCVAVFILPAPPALVSQAGRALVWGWEGGSQDWQPAGQGNHFSRCSGVGPGQIFSATDSYQSCGIPKRGTGDYKAVSFCLKPDLGIRLLAWQGREMS